MAEKVKKAEKTMKKTETKKEAKAGRKPAELAKDYIPRLKTYYEKEVRKALQEEYKYSSTMAIPKLEKITLNMGVGDAVTDKTTLDSAIEELSIIAGQRAVKTIARKSVSNFKLREGMPIGARVTLRGDRMYDFLDKLISVALPRVRDFRGLKRSSFDGRGNYSFGIREQIVFPEINYDKISKVRGMDITIVTTAPNDEQAFSLLKYLGMPFREK